MTTLVRDNWRRGAPFFAFAATLSALAASLTAIDGRFANGFMFIAALVWGSTAFTTLLFARAVLLTLPVSHRRIGRMAWWTSYGSCAAVTALVILAINLPRAMRGSSDLQFAQVLQWLLYTVGFSSLAFSLFPIEGLRQDALKSRNRGVAAALDLIWTPAATLIILCLLFDKCLTVFGTLAAGGGVLLAILLYLEPTRLADKVVLTSALHRAMRPGAASRRSISVRLGTVLADSLRPSRLMALAIVVTVVVFVLGDPSKPLLPGEAQALRAQLHTWLPTIIACVAIISVVTGGGVAVKRALSLRALRALPLTAHQIVRMLMLRAAAPALFAVAAALLINEWTAFAARSVLAAIGIHIAVTLTIWPASMISAGTMRRWLRMLLLLVALLWTICLPAVVLVTQSAILVWLSAPPTIGIVYWKLYGMIACKSESYAAINVDIDAISRLR